MMLDSPHVPLHSLKPAMVAGGQAVTHINCFQLPTQASGGLQTNRERAIPFKNFVDLNYVIGEYRRD